MFVLNSEITIDDTVNGGQVLQFSGAHSISIRRSLHSYADAAVIRLPSIATIKKNNKQIVTGVTTGSQFGDGAKITIKLGYNGSLVEEFRGFIKRRNLNMPLEVECEGYVRQLRLNNAINKNLPTTSVAELLKLATQGTDIKVQVPVDIPLGGINLAGYNGADICELIKKATDNTVSIFFIDPVTLWCGLVYTPYAQGTDAFSMAQVNYRLGYNVVKDNSLKESAQSDPVQVVYNSKQATGQVLSQQSDKKANAILKRLLAHIPTSGWLKQLCQEKEYRLNYQGYEGSINAFLQPYALPGYTAQIVDARYPERNGIYIIESAEIEFGMNGARRSVEIGPKLGGWADN